MPDTPLSILYVDDESLLLQVVKEYLTRFQFIVDTAISGAEALQKFSENTYDAIISDYQMPGMDGIGLLQEIRSRDADIPFILFTGRGREEVVIEAIDSGVDFYVQKGGQPAPQFKELVHKIRIAVRRIEDRKALIESEHRFRSLIQNSSDIIRILDKEGIILFDSPSSSKILEYPEGSLIGTSAFDYIHPEDRDRVQSDFQDVYHCQNDHTPTEYRIRKADGTYLYVESIALNLLDTPGVNGIVTTTHPIQNRKMAEFRMKQYADDLAIAYEQLASTEEELRSSFVQLQEKEQALLESEERFRSMAERTSDLIILISQNFLPIYISPSAVSVVGYSPDELIEKPAEFWAETIFSPSSLEFMGYVQRTMQGESFSNLEIEIKKKDGSHAFMSTSAVPAVHDGNVTGIQISMRDKTPVKKAELALRESEERYRLLAEHIHDVIWKTDERMRITYVSPSVTDMLGYTPDEAVQLSFRDLLTPDSYQRIVDYHYQWMEQLLDNEKVADKSVIELEFIRKDKTRVCSEIMVKPLYTDDEFIGLLGAARDITQRKHAEKALKSANHQLSLLTSVTRHDILNKISVIIAYLSLIDQEYTSPQVDEYLRVVKLATDEIQSQIEFTRVYQDLGSQQPGWFVLDEVMPRSVFPVEIQYMTDLHRFVLYGDPMLEKVFFNLLDNSVRHGECVTDIQVSAGDSDEGLVIIWEDNGTGIPAQEKEVIFDRGVGKNTGFGLFLVREILLLTGITIQENGVPGKGARFEIRVPKGVYRIVN